MLSVFRQMRIIHIESSKKHALPRPPEFGTSFASGNSHLLSFWPYPTKFRETP
jgi:hypothetical protein